MKQFLLFFTIITVYSCNSSKDNKTKPEHYIPETSQLILKVNSFESLKNDVENNSFLQSLSDSKFYSNLTTVIHSLDSLVLNPNFICFEKDSINTYYSIIGKLKDSIKTSRIQDHLYHTIKDSIFIISNSKTTIEKFQPYKNSRFEKFIEIANTDSSLSVFLSNETTNDFGQSLINSSINGFSDWTTLETKLFPNGIEFSGIAFNTDFIPNLLSVFQNTIPQENTIQQITPLTSDGFLSVTFEDFQNLNKNLNIYNEVKTDSITETSIFETIHEIGEIYLDDTPVVILKSIDAETTKDALLDSQSVSSTFRNVSIFNFNNNNLFHNTFKPLLSNAPVSKYIILGDFFAFSNSTTNLKQLITNYQNGTVLSTSNTFKTNSKALSDEASLLIVANSKQLKQISEALFNDTFKISAFKNYPLSTFQFISDNGFTHVNGIIKKETQKTLQKGITEVFNISIDNDILMAPHFVTNHRTKEKEIVVQDINNYLHLISNNGSVLWKKQLNGPILGKIQQVDLYNNRRLQLAFATPNRVYIIDRNGKDVTPFPLQFNNAITQPLSIFDYDNKKSYRFLITQDNVLIMYDKNGKTVDGFNYQKTNTIKTQPKHFRISGKDYIVFAVGVTMKILNRQGKNRITVKDAINFSENSIFNYKNKFTTTSNNGELIQVNLNGVTSKQNLKLETVHKLETTNKTLVTLSDNILTIKQKSIELDFGSYTRPKIFYLKDKIYVAITDLQTQKVLLFDSQTNLLTNFPVYGNSNIDLANIDRDSQLEFVVKGDTNSIILYKKN